MKILGGALAACGTSLLPLARPLKEAMAVAATVGLQELLGAVHPAGRDLESSF